MTTGNFDAEKISRSCSMTLPAFCPYVFACKLLTPMPSTVHSDWLLLAGECAHFKCCTKARDEANAATTPSIGTQRSSFGKFIGIQSGRWGRSSLTTLVLYLSPLRWSCRAGGQRVYEGTNVFE